MRGLIGETLSKFSFPLALSLNLSITSLLWAVCPFHFFHQKIINFISRVTGENKIEDGKVSAVDFQVARRHSE